MNAARMVLVLALAWVVLATGCTPASGGGSARTTEVPPGISSQFAGLLSLADPAAFRTAAAERGFATTADGVVLDIQTQGLEAGHRAEFDLPGLVVRSFRPEYERVSAVARLPFVRVVAPSFGAKTRGSGSADY